MFRFSLFLSFFSSLCLIIIENDEVSVFPSWRFLKKDENIFLIIGEKV